MTTGIIAEFLELPLRVVLMYAWKKEGRLWSEAGAEHVPSESNEVKVWGRLREFLLVDCCGWVVILGSACVEICWRLAHWECFPSVESSVWVARAGT